MPGSRADIIPSSQRSSKSAANSASGRPMVEGSAIQLMIDRKGPRRAFGGVIGLAVLLVLYWAWRGAEMDPLSLFRDSGNSLQIGREFLSPNFHEWRFYLEQLVVTVQMAI